MLGICNFNIWFHAPNPARAEGHALSQTLPQTPAKSIVSLQGGPVKLESNQVKAAAFP
jgi:hypothetical protein